MPNKCKPKCYCTTCRRKKLKKKDPIKYWAARWIDTNKWTKGRKKVDKEITITYLVKKYKEGKKKYPRMNLDGGLWSVSVDRINSDKHYKKGNIQIIPIWLNNAKINFSMKEINTVIEEYYKEILN